jgi:hypothetical protein
MTSKLEQLKQFTTVVCDTGGLEAISRLQFARGQEKLETLLADA